ncbi:MAG: RHS repeat-associated core domain-containing protein [Gammaproteobacteria bacterium]
MSYEYGNIMDDMNPDFQPLMYAGGLYDADTKLIRFGARDYDPTIGRWTTKDPIGFEDDLNRYAYCGGNHMSCTDPTGEFGIWGAAFGAAVEIAVQAHALQAAGKDVYDYQNYDVANIIMSGAVSAIAPGWLKVGKTGVSALQTAAKVTARLRLPAGLKYASHLQSKRAAELIKFGKITGIQLTYQGGKYGFKRLNNQMCEMNGTQQ